jgi:hypothetical protein
MTSCRCTDESLLWGAAADDYAETHLVRERVGERAREVSYRCPQTGRRWIMDVAEDDQGEAALRLRRLLGAAELVEHLSRLRTWEEHVPFWDPDIELQPPGSEELVKGADRVREYARNAAADPNTPRARALSVIDLGEQAVVLGNVSHRRGGRYVEHRPAAWLVAARGGRMYRSLYFDSWEAAREAAGLKGETDGPAARQIGRRLLFAVRRALAGRQLRRPACG